MTLALGTLDDKLMKHPKLLEAAAVSGSRTVEELLVRWSVQRGVPFAIDANASAAAVTACADAHGFRRGEGRHRVHSRRHYVHSYILRVDTTFHQALTRLFYIPHHP